MAKPELDLLREADAAGVPSWGSVLGDNSGQGSWWLGGALGASGDRLDRGCQR